MSTVMNSNNTVNNNDDGNVNREKTCPLLLRMFCSTKKHNNVMEYSRGKTPLNELQVYTWLDATLRELASLVKQVNPESRKRGTLFDFALVFPDHRIPTYRMRELGTVCSGNPSDTDKIMLKDVQFTIGDMIDVAITLPYENSDVHHPFQTNKDLSILNSNNFDSIRIIKRNSPQLKHSLPLPTSGPSLLLSSSDYNYSKSRDKYRDSYTSKYRQFNSSQQSSTTTTTITNTTYSASAPSTTTTTTTNTTTSSSNNLDSENKSHSETSKDSFTDRKMDEKSNHHHHQDKLSNRRRVVPY